MTAKTKNSMQDYRKQDIASLNEGLKNKRLVVQELFGQLAIGKLTSHTQIRAARREIARIQTVKNEKTILESLNNG